MAERGTSLWVYKLPCPAGKALVQASGGASPLAVSIAFPLLYVNILVTADFLQKVAWIFTSHAFAHAALPLSAIQPPAHSYTLLIQH